LSRSIRYRSFTPGKSKLTFSISVSKIDFQPVRHKGRRVLDFKIKQLKYSSVSILMALAKMTNKLFNPMQVCLFSTDTALSLTIGVLNE